MGLLRFRRRSRSKRNLWLSCPLSPVLYPSNFVARQVQWHIILFPLFLPLIKTGPRLMYPRNMYGGTVQQHIKKEVISLSCGRDCEQL